jgi:hypothetical protein
MDLEDLGPRLGCGLVLTVVVGLMSIGLMKSQSDMVNAIQHENSEAGQPQPISSAMAQQQKRGTDFTRAIEAGQFDEAEKLAAEAPKDDPARHDFPRRIASAREQAARKAMETGDDAAVRTHLTALERSPERRDRSTTNDLWAKWAVKRFEKSGGDGDAALAPLIEVASRIGPGHSGEVERVLRDRLPGERVLEVGQGLLARNPIAACMFLEAAQNARKAGENVRNAAREALPRAQLDAAKLILAGKAPGLGSEHVRRLLDQARSGRDPAARAEALQGLLEAQILSCREARAANDFQRASHELRQAADLARDAWLARIELPGADPLAKIPQAERELLEDRNLGEPPARVLDELKQRVRSGQWVPPEAGAIRAELPGLQADWGLADLAKNREAALPMLRAVLRGDDAAARAKVTAGLREAVRAALEKSDFPVLLDLCGFTVAELSIQPGDPFRDEIKKGLEAAGEHFRTSSPMSRVFVLSLMADVLAPDPAAETARAEALETGAKLMSTLSKQDMNMSKLRFPTGLPGTSVLRIDNGTEYHLMVFFDGPEKFFVRLNPVRRGTVALKDGTYQTAVIVTKDDVVPYRGELACQSDVQSARYYIRREGRAQGYDQFAGSASGPYRLLRTPAGSDAKALAKFAGDSPAEGEDGEGLAKWIADLRVNDTGKVIKAIEELEERRDDPEAFEAVKQAALSHTIQFARLRAVKALHVFRRKFDAAAVLAGIARGDADKQAASAALDAIVLGGLEGADKLLEERAQSPDREVRRRLVRDLSERAGYLPGEKGDLLLLTLIEKDPEVQIKRAAARALAQRKSPQALPLAEAMIRSADAADRLEAMSIVVAYMKDAKGDELLAGALAAEKERRVRAELLRMLSARGAPAYAQLLADVVARGTPVEKLDAMHYLYCWDGELAAVENALVTASADADPKVKAKAAKELERLRREKSKN